jgi:hypothetical protein
MEKEVSMQETLQGEGTLRRFEAEWNVKYSFAITTAIREKPGFPRTRRVKATVLGSISAIDGKPIPEGYYDLTAQNGEILRVKNTGVGQWTILAPLLQLQELDVGLHSSLNE